MTAGIYNLTVEQGATFEQSFLIKDATGATLDLTGCSASMQVRISVGDPTALLSLTTANGGLVMSAGTITPIFDPNALTPGYYVYDLKLTDSGGEAFRLLQGSVTVTGAVTTI